jgi:dihydrodipicolinate reductase
MASKINAIVTGATGMVGEGVLHEILQHHGVESVLVINRKPCGASHLKLKEIIHTDCYISGAGTDGTEKGRMMWARVKKSAKRET